MQHSGFAWLSMGTTSPGGGGSIMTIVWETLESSKIKLERLRALSLSRVRVSYESPRWEEKKPTYFQGLGLDLLVPYHSKEHIWGKASTAKPCLPTICVFFSPYWVSISILDKRENDPPLFPS